MSLNALTIWPLCWSSMRPLSIAFRCSTMFALIFFIFVANSVYFSKLAQLTSGFQSASLYSDVEFNRFRRIPSASSENFQKPSSRYWLEPCTVIHFSIRYSCNEITWTISSRLLKSSRLRTKCELERTISLSSLSMVTSYIPALNCFKHTQRSKYF